MAAAGYASDAQALLPFEAYLRPRFANWNPGSVEDGDDIFDPHLWRLRIASIATDNKNILNHLDLKFYDQTQRIFKLTRLSHYLAYCKLQIGQSGLQQELLDLISNPQAQFERGLSIWCEDITGHVSLAERSVFDVL